MKLGVVGLLSCLVLSVSAMQEAQSLRDALARHEQQTKEIEESRSPSLRLSGLQTRQPMAGKELPTCGICFDDMVPEDTFHTQCIDEHHLFHKHCLARWYGTTSQQGHTGCPMCLRLFLPHVKKILEDTNPVLRRARERKEFWAKFAHFTALGLTVVTVVGIPFLLKEKISGPGLRGPVFEDAMRVMLPVTIAAAMPLEQHARSLS